MMNGSSYILRKPDKPDEWGAYHAIRRKVLFENRGSFEVYNDNHPDEHQNGNHPLVLLYDGKTIGVIRVDVQDHVAWLRRVAVREDLQGAGHGRVLLHLAESFAREQKCDEVRSNVAVDAVGFYERCGYSSDYSTPAQSKSIPMLKRLL